jgi:hypothetical protein
VGLLETAVASPACQSTTTLPLYVVGAAALWHDPAVRPTGRCWVQRGVLNCLSDAVQHSRMRWLWTSAAVCRTVAPSSVGAASLAARTPGVRLSTAAAGLVVRRGLRDGTGTGTSTRTVAGRPAPATIEYEGRSYASSMRVPFEVRVISDVMGSGVVAAAPIKCGAEIFHEADVVEVCSTDRLPPRAPNFRCPRDPWNPPRPRPAHTPWRETASLRELASCVPSCMGARAAPRASLADGCGCVRAGGIHAP